MNKLLYFIIILFAAVQTGIKAQSTHNHAQCGVSYEDGMPIKNRMLENRRNKAELLQSFNSRSGRKYAPVMMHIVNKNDGSGGAPIQTALNFLCNINDHYQSMVSESFDTVSIEFYLAGPIRFINSTLLYEDGHSSAANYFMNMYRVPGPINVFFVNETPGSGGFYQGSPQGNGLINDFICIPRSGMTTVSTGPHEFGHFFTLPHTFFGWEDLLYSDVVANSNGRTPSFIVSGVEVENIARSGPLENCEIAADGFCGTNPSFAFGGAGSTYSNACDYAATAHDPYGYMFRPQYIGPVATTFKMGEDNQSFTNMSIQNTSSKDRLYPKTLIVVETGFRIGAGSFTQMWQDTIGDSDSTQIYCPANGTDDIINAGSQGSVDVIYGFINMGPYVLDMNISSTNPDLSFIHADADFTVTGSTHLVEMDSLKVTNNSTTDTVISGTVITIDELFHEQDTCTNSITNGTMTDQNQSVKIDPVNCHGAGIQRKVTLDLSSTSDGSAVCTGHAFQLWVNNDSVKVICDVSNFDISAYIPVDSVKLVSVDWDNNADSITYTLDLNVLHTAAGTVTSSDSRTINLPDSIPPGESYTFSAAALSNSSTTIAGVSFEINTFSPSNDTIHVNSDNFMSYYSYVGCTQFFTPDQVDAIAIDYAARAYETNYPTPSNIDITDPVTVNNPIDGAVAPNPVIQFLWNSVNGATMYRVHIYEVNFLGIPVSNGVEFDFMTESTESWLTLVPNKNYEWRVYPLNPTTFCNHTAFGSVKAKFEVMDWTIGVEDIQAEIESSKIYPNPTGTNQDIILEVLSSVVTTAKLSIINSIGQTVMPDVPFDLVIGNNIQQLNTAALAAGLYIINIETKNGIVSHKLMIEG